ncbi:MAG: TlpA family protein disulfide reductase [Oscillospiraceae bacterium]|jgi:peroxiredoxin|nr:TlpA family protein disulfide reductase [Oscillospiraceae bacterium]
MTLAKKSFILTAAAAVIGGVYAIKHYLNNANIGDKSAPKPKPADYNESYASIACGDCTQSATEYYNLPEAPDFRFEDGGGNTMTLAEFFEKPCYLYFWVSNSADCDKEFAYIENMYGKYKGNINFLAMNLTGTLSDSKKSAAEFEATHSCTFPIYFDVHGDGRRAFDVFTAPESVFITKGGKVKYRKSGAINEKSIEKQLARL